MPANQSLGSIATQSLDRIQDPPSTVSNGSVQSYIEFAMEDIKNWFGESSISTTAVPVKYQNILVNLGAAYVMGRKLGVGVDFDFSLGEFRASRGAATNSPDAQQLRFFIEQINMGMKGAHRDVKITKVYGV